MDKDVTVAQGLRYDPETKTTVPVALTPEEVSEEGQRRQARVAKDAADQEARVLKAAIVTTARGAEGKALNTLSANEVRALMAVLLWKAGGVADNGTVKALSDWA